MKKYNSFILFSSLLFIAVFIIEHLNQRFWLNDFQVYYSAAEALKNGSQVYGQSFGLSTGFYKYSPFTLLCFIPTTIFEYDLAASLHFCFLGICTILSLISLQQILIKNNFYNLNKKENVVLILSLVCVVNHLVRELHLGNVNMLIVLLLCGCLYFESSSKPIWAGFAFALALLIKPYLIILGIPLLLYKKYKTILSSMVVTAIAVIVVTILYGFTLSFQLHTDWLKAMLDHGSYLQSSHTIISILNKLGGQMIQQQHQLYLMAAMLFIYIVVFFLWIRPQQTVESKQKNFIITFFVLFALLPNLLITDTEHFLYALPIIFISLTHLFNTKNKILTACFVACILMYGANSSDLLGNTLSNHFEEWGLLGIGNLGLIGLFIYSQIKTKTLTS